MNIPEKQTPRVPSTDGELVMRFRRHRDGDAFTELVQKHGPVVWSACQQVLGSHHDAEDAFQATFLILAQHFPFGHRINSLAGWLHKVAYRTAVRTRRKHRNHEEIQDIESLPSTDDVFASITQRELRRVLHNELSRMPERYQAPLVLCYLQGKSRTEAAEELDCTDASVKARLARGRKLLRSRLLRRGLALSAAITATGSAVVEAAQQLPPMLIEGTVDGCLAAASADTTAHVSTKAQALAREGGRIMLVSKALQIASACIGAALVCLVGTFALNDVGASGSPQSTKVHRITAAMDIEPPPAEEANVTLFSGGSQTAASDAAAEAASEIRRLRSDMDMLLDAERYSENEVRHLEDWVNAVQKIYNRTRELFDAGAPGGEVEHEALARYHLNLAKARLAFANRDLVQCEKWHVACVSAAEEAKLAVEEAFDAGTVSLDMLLEPQQRVAEARINLSRIRSRMKQQTGPGD